MVRCWSVHLAASSRRIIGTAAMMRRLAVAAFILALSCVGAFAQSCWPDPNNTRANCGQPVMFLNPASQAIPASAANPLPFTLSPTSPGITPLGQTVKAQSLPVTIASDQYVDPCQSPNIAKSSAVVNITTAGTTSLVPVSGSTVFYVCGISLTISQVATTANTVLFEYGTGAACTGPVPLTGNYSAGGITAGAPIVVNASNGGTIFKSAASNGVCALTTIGASGSFQGVLTYVQQ